MNEEFLRRYRKSPSREFSDALYKRISVQMNTKRTPPLRRLTFAAALCMALIAALAFSPSARAAFNGLIVEIGQMVFFEPEETASQATPLPESQVTIVPQETLPLAEAQARLPYSISLPTWTPDGFKMGTAVRISYFPGATPQVTITWYGSDPNIGNIDLTIFGQRVDWLVETNDVQEVEVNGQPAALVSGSWDADTGQWNNRAARMLNWMKGNEMYQLYSPGAAVEDLIRIAESIP
jgi:hypothetical protein